MYTRNRKMCRSDGNMYKWNMYRNMYNMWRNVFRNRKNRNMFRNMLRNMYIRSGNMYTWKRNVWISGKGRVQKP